MLTITEVVPSGIYRGAHPKSSDDYRLLKDKFGIRTLINLETGLYERLKPHDTPEGEAAAMMGMNYFHIPQSNFLAPSEIDVVHVLMKLTDQFYWPTYIHCRHGVDRTGFMVAMYRIRIEKWAPERAIKEMKDMGFHTWSYFHWIPRLKH